MAGIVLGGVHKSFGEVEVIRGVDLEIEDREFVVFVGPSGCGKSTMLRLITGRSKVECKLMIRNKGTVASSPKAINTMGMPIRTVFGKVLVKPCMALSPKSRRSKF